MLVEKEKTFTENVEEGTREDEKVFNPLKGE